MQCSNYFTIKKGRLQVITYKYLTCQLKNDETISLLIKIHIST